MARETGARIARECGGSRRAGGGPPPRVAHRDERADGGRARRGVGGPTVVAPYGEWRARDWRVAAPPDPASPGRCHVREVAAVCACVRDVFTAVCLHRTDEADAQRFRSCSSTRSSCLTVAEVPREFTRQTPPVMRAIVSNT